MATAVSECFTRFFDLPGPDWGDSPDWDPALAAAAAALPRPAPSPGAGLVAAAMPAPAPGPSLVAAARSGLETAGAVAQAQLGAGPVADSAAPPSSVGADLGAGPEGEASDAMEGEASDAMRELVALLQGPAREMLSRLPIGELVHDEDARDVVHELVLLAWGRRRS